MYQRGNKLKREVIKVITKEQAVNLVKEFETAKAEQIKKGVNDYLENVVSPKIKGTAKDGYSKHSTTVPHNVDLDLVKAELVKVGFTISQGIGERNIIISW